MDPSIRAMQQHLASSGDDPGPADGVLGPHTLGAMMDYVSQRESGAVDRKWVSALWTAVRDAELTTRLRMCHLLGQTCVETASFRTLVEYGGMEYFKRYDGRLGNTHPGDGYRFRGRGFVMLTGRANYATYGAKLGLPLVSQPDTAAEPEPAARILVAYWNDHGCSSAAEADDCTTVTRKINGGTNGLVDRQHRTSRLLLIWP